jgi:hypothetical protein
MTTTCSRLRPRAAHRPVRQQHPGRRPKARPRPSPRPSSCWCPRATSPPSPATVAPASTAHSSPTERRWGDLRRGVPIPGGPVPGRYGASTGLFAVAAPVDLPWGLRPALPPPASGLDRRRRRCRRGDGFNRDVVGFGGRRVGFPHVVLDLGTGAEDQLAARALVRHGRQRGRSDPEEATRRQGAAQA